jgi:4-diphosphocytidyl-2-C-methyl-D-erythritol kinase
MPTAPKKQGALQYRTPAKLTLVLKVLGRRADGFHDVKLALVPVSIYDFIIFLPGETNVRLEVFGPEDLGPPENNLVYRAAMAYQEAAGVPVRGILRLIKHIPSGAGLGGGSGNAAATLVALDRLHGHRLGAVRLREIALGLGSDVPFFLEPRPQWAEGRGERLTPLPDLPRLHLIVVKPAFPISTAEAYGQVRPRERRAGVPELTTPGQVLRAMENDFEAALFPRYPELARIKTRLLEAGALGALLSGTGSALFGVFADAAQRDAAALRLRGQPGWAVHPCESLASHDYEAVCLGPDGT